MNLEPKFRETTANIIKQGAIGLKPWQKPWEEHEEIASTKTFEPIPILEEIIKATGAVIRRSVRKQSSYSPGLDKIYMPDRKQFKNALGYYATLFHELGHRTGHASRLDRPTIMEETSDEGKAIEELIAELTSAFILGIFGLDATANSASYIAHHMEDCPDQYKAFTIAIHHAQKAVKHILNVGEEQ